MDLTVETKRLGEQRVLVEVTGEMDVFRAPVFKETIARLIEEGDHYIVVDMRKVSYMDSTGLAVLIGGLKRAREHGGNLCLVAPHRRVRRILEITDLDKVLLAYDHLEEAQEKVTASIGEKL